MKNLFFGLVLIGAFNSAHAGDKGNGGDILKCKENGTTIYRTLDSVITKDQPFFERINYQSYDEALESILNHFNKTLPLMGVKLQSFLATYKNKRDEKKDIFWVKTKLQQVNDENLYVAIPDYCDDNPIQSVILIKEGIKRYYYDPLQLSKIESVDDELSWMLIHEFLRDFIDDSDIIRIVNAYIHSSDFLQDDENGVKGQLERLGLRYGKGSTFSEYQKDISVANNVLDSFSKKEKELSKIIGTDFSKLSNSEKEKLRHHLMTLKISSQDRLDVKSVDDFLPINEENFYNRANRHNETVESLISQTTTLSLLNPEP